MSLHRKLTPAQEREYLSYVKEMRAEGVPIDIPDEWEQRARSLEITIAPPPDNQVFECASGGLRYWIYVRLLSKTRCVVERAAIDVPWDHQVVLEKLDKKYPVGMYGYPPVAWKDVLNARIDNRLKFARAGEVVEGFILGSGVEPFPQEYSKGGWVAFKLSLYDQYNFELAEHGYLYVESAAGRGQTRRAPRTDVFGEPLSSSQGGDGIHTASSDGQQEHSRSNEQ